VLHYAEDCSCGWGMGKRQRECGEDGRDMAVGVMKQMGDAREERRPRRSHDYDASDNRSRCLECSNLPSHTSRDWPTRSVSMVTWKQKPVLVERDLEQSGWAMGMLGCCGKTWST
jgi:hypothetical protein